MNTTTQAKVGGWRALCKHVTNKKQKTVRQPEPNTLILIQNRNEAESSLSALVLSVVVTSNLGFLKNDANDVCFDIFVAKHNS